MGKRMTQRALVYRTVRRAGERRRRRQSIKALVPARGGSKGVSRKNLLMVAGYPLLAHSILTLRAAGISEAWVSTEDEQIMQVARTYGAHVLVRPEELATDDASTEDVISHFLANVSCDVVVMVQCTSPMLQPQHIVNGLNKMLACGLDSVFSAVKADDMLVWDAELHPMNYRPERRGRRQTRREHIYVESGGFYIFTRRMFSQHGCRIGGNFGVTEVPFWQSFQVDNKHDVANIRRLMERR
jgi:CMP-N,N'-diacetyllegionaminic acid synthase